MTQRKDWEAFLCRLKKDLMPSILISYQDVFDEFINDFFAITSIEEMESRKWSDLTAGTLNIWEKALKFKSESLSLDVFNPDDAMGFSSNHTLIQVIQQDSPFLVDSIRMKLNAKGISSYSILSGTIPLEEIGLQAMPLGVAVIEIDRMEDTEKMARLQTDLINVLGDVKQCVEAFYPIKQAIFRLADFFENRKNKNSEYYEIEAYLRWLLNDNFTFLGLEHFDVKYKQEQYLLQRTEKQSFGLLHEDSSHSSYQIFNDEFFSKGDTLSFSKSLAKSTVHRPAYPDFIIIKKSDSSGKIKSICRILGLYTSPVFNQSVSLIPILRKKCQTIIERSKLSIHSHPGKELKQILQTFPREELFQLNETELFNTAMGILQIQERNLTKVFFRHDTNGQFCSVLLYIPREVYSTALQMKIQSILHDSLKAIDSEFFTFFSESVLARIHFILRLKKQDLDSHDLKIIGEKIIEVSTSWDYRLKSELVKHMGEEKGLESYAMCRSGIPISYKEKYSPKVAQKDIATCLDLHNQDIQIHFFKRQEKDKILSIKVFHRNKPLPLADQIPVMDHLGFRVISEHPYTLTLNTEEKQNLIWLHDFELEYFVPSSQPLSEIAPKLEEAFLKSWHKEIDTDPFNRIILSTGLDCTQINVFRAYARYMKQLKFGLSQEFIARVLYTNSEITLTIWQLFVTRFDLHLDLNEDQRMARQQQLQQDLTEKLETVDSLSDDQVLRRYIDLIIATLRTNFYQHYPLDSPFISFKLASSTLIDIPKPAPVFEIFVYSTRFEGVHLRGGKVARGGLRWSDRHEDFRTEILGLVKAQQVKNAVIVPVGAKGGFVCKWNHMTDREAILEEGLFCYSQFIRGLLDLTDNFVKNKVIPPKNTITYDQDDYYLVVAADKGTATFSDTANKIAAEYQFWLGDAFASGGSIGYDHKKMGITAKGAWESAKRHFSALGLNLNKDMISVIGIGDMSGDVFGNGMLISENIQLVAAFNHLHIMIDPNPDVKTSYLERKRLFNLPRSNWSDYDKSLISQGGNVFSRNAKMILISPEMKARFHIQANKLKPSELLSAILKAPVDLLWNAGIGTYVKHSSESHEDVNDHANDGLRINGNQLQCRIVCEGGNLGFTQLGRVEYALNGGIINTDFIDNAGGVDCSDHEVNIKIFLNYLVSKKKITNTERTQLLEKMTQDVAALVLKNNYRQALAISLAVFKIAKEFDRYKQLIHDLEIKGKLDRDVEFFPDDETLNERITSEKMLTRPEISLLMSYSKTSLKEELLASKIVDDPYLISELLTEFPSLLIKKYPTELASHRLKREIIATQMANHTLNCMGMTFITEMKQFNHTSLSDIMKAYISIRDIYQFDSHWLAIEALDFQIDQTIQLTLFDDLRYTIKRLMRWMLQMNLAQDTIQDTVTYYQTGVHSLLANIDHIQSEELREQMTLQIEHYVNNQVPKDLAEKLARMNALTRILFIIQTANETKQPLHEVAAVYFAVSDLLSLDWLLRQISQMNTSGYWNIRAKENNRDDLFTCLTLFVRLFLKQRNPDISISQSIESWKNDNKERLARWTYSMSELKLEPKLQLPMLSVIGRELLESYENFK
ncbi:MAG: NAD-glutamate dehydrogenase [Endozoicomonadaceae bacterium]|nr:NAD-glutamate dehydrogenase [Endozoicomonadaceae bacterium]